MSNVIKYRPKYIICNVKVSKEYAKAEMMMSKLNQIIKDLEYNKLNKYYQKQIEDALQHNTKAKEKR